MLPAHDERGNIAGFLGRARPGADPEVPKYLNSPGTSRYQKGSLLFGLHQACDLLARGTTPVIVEGPFDAIAVTFADPGHHVGLAPCGTALTSKQAAILAQSADLDSTGVLVAFDDDPAGRKAAVRAHEVLRTVSGRLQSAVLSGKDPAEILQTEGPVALRTVLRDQVQPLSSVVIDAHLAPWERRLHDPEGPLLAIRSTATVIAVLPAEASARAPYGRGIYTAEWTERTYREVLRRAAVLLAHGESAIADASFASAQQRAAAAATAAETNADLVQLRCTTPGELAARRMSARTGAVSDADQAIAAEMEAVAEPWPDAAVIDTESGGTARVAGESVDRALEAVRPCGPEHIWRPARRYILPG